MQTEVAEINPCGLGLALHKLEPLTALAAGKSGDVECSHAVPPKLNDGMGCHPTGRRGQLPRPSMHKGEHPFYSLVHHSSYSFLSSAIAHQQWGLQKVMCLSESGVGSNDDGFC